MSQTRDQKRFIISEVAADWHELIIPWCIMRPSIAHAVGPAVQHTDIPLPQSATLGLLPVARKLLLIAFPVKGRRLEYRILIFRLLIFLLLRSQMNCGRSCCVIYHLTSNLLPHYQVRPGAICPSCRHTHSIKALKGDSLILQYL